MTVLVSFQSRDLPQVHSHSNEHFCSTETGMLMNHPVEEKLAW